MALFLAITLVLLILVIAADNWSAKCKKNDSAGSIAGARYINFPSTNPENEEDLADR